MGRCRNWVLMLTFQWLLVSAEMDRPHCEEHSTNCLYINVDTLTNVTVIHVNDTNIDVTFTKHKIVYDCFGTNKTMDNDSLPKLDRVVGFNNVFISDCIPPAGLYKEALAAVNITGFRHLTLWFEYCTDSNSFNNFAPHNFENFDDLETLQISCIVFELDYFDLLFLKPLKNLKHLTLAGMKIPPMPLWNRIPSIELYNTDPMKKLQPWGGCHNLETLLITFWGGTKLPDSWLAHCPRLVSVHLQDFMDLVDNPLHMINSTSLHTLKVNGCHLSRFSKDLLTHGPNLRVLHLSDNGLETIDRSVFASINLLEDLDLSNNFFGVKFLPELAPLEHLRSLSLDSCFSGNDDICIWTSEEDGNVTNPWPVLPALESLSLQNIEIKHFCSTWPKSMPSLKLLNLTEVQLTELHYKDIQNIRSNNLEVDLRNSNFEAIVYEKSDYEHILGDLHLSNSNGRLWIDSPLDCDCRWYWFARAQQERPAHFGIPDLQCRLQWRESANLVPFVSMNPESCMCKIDCEFGCECYRRAHDNTIQINCTGAGLTHMPRLPQLRKIDMGNNHIEELHMDDFSETLERMDLQFNQLSVIDEKTASMMFSQHSTRYRLEGNPIMCTCINSAFIEALQHHHNQILDYDNITCVHGQPIRYINTSTLCLNERTLPIAALFVSIALLFLITLAVYFRYRHQIHIMLYAWGWCFCCVAENELDNGKPYDAFVSYAYEDSTFVMNELLVELEKKPHPFKVCVHYRDWVAGEWIPAQIAQSIEDSRRTIIVLSKNFLSSIWALLEFRTALTQAMKDGRSRLIIVLLEDVINDTMMEEELRTYLSNNTYIKWGDPRFWDKLRYALPHQVLDARRMRAAGERVVRLSRSSDPPAVLRGNGPLETLRIETEKNS